MTRQQGDLSSAVAGAVAVAASLLAVLGLAHGFTQDNTFPGMICTVKPAILPSGLFFSSNETATSASSVTEIRAHVSNSTTLVRNGTITFTRTFQTGNEFTTPEGVAINRTDNGVKIILPNFKNTTGIYTLTMESTIGTISTLVILHAADSDPRPSRPTVTYNIGENAQLRIVRNNLMGLKWTRTADDRLLPQGDNKDILNIEGVTAYNGTVYEAYAVGKRHEPHSVLRLIVRECPAGFWGLNTSCNKECPICYSGGMCNDKTGECVCAPGFSGKNCENLHGGDSFGEYGQFNCSETESAAGCRGILFCLSDPYGCSCAAGFRGFGCNQECDSGYFGADCLQECHCEDNLLCAKDTGRCEGQNDCELGYTGSNCQDKLKLMIDASTAKERNVGNTATVRCLSFLPVVSQEITLVLPNGDIITPRTMTPTVYGATAEFDVTLNSATQMFTCVVRTATEHVNKTASVDAYVPPQLHDPPSADLRPISPTKVFVNWNPWEDGYDIGDGPVISYHVQYRKAHTDETFTTYSKGTKNSVSIPLDRETMYEIVVITVRPGEGGEGQRSPSTFVTTECNIPTGVPVLMSEPERGKQSFTLSWQLPSPDTWGCSRVTTNILYQGATHNIVTLPSPSDAGVSLNQTVTISDLTPCTEYTVVLWLTNSEGRAGPQTERKVVAVGGAVPGIVTDVALLAVRPTRIKFAWDKPLTGCDVEEYNVTYQLVNFDQCNQTVSAITKWKRKSADRPRHGIGSEPDVIPPKILLVPYSTYNITITAKSLDGVGETFYLLQRTDSTYPSDAPTNITATEIKEESVLFTWAPVLCGSRHGLIDNYTARLTDEIGGKVVTRHVGAHFNSVSYINLSSCTNYSFVIRADVGDQPGPFSDPLLLATPIGLPVTVTDLRAFAPRADFIYASWDRPNNTRCDLVYHIEYSLSVRDQCVRYKGETIMYDKWTYDMNNELGGLEPFSTYTIYVTASTPAGNGTRAAVVATTKQTAPGAVANVTAHSVTASNITFEWEAPPCGQRHGIIEGYHYILNSSDVTVHEGTTSSTETFVTFDDLEGCTSYEFQVRAWTRKGNGTFSMSVVAVTGVSAPDAISELYVEPQGPEALHVSWKPPINTPCPISHYIITHALLNKEQCREMDPDVTRRNVSINDVMHVIRNLSPYSTYSISVMAETEGGIGSSLFVIRNTTSDVPGRIKTVTLTDKTKSSLSFEWESPACGYKRGPITGYSYLVTTEDGEEVVENVTETSHVTIGDLKPCHTYEILVKSLNAYTNTAGLYSPKVNGSTSVATPDAISELYVEPQGPEALHVSWKAPIDTPCPISNYIITHALLNKEQCREMDPDVTRRNVSINDVMHVIRNLSPYSTYSISVMAETEGGIGSALSVIRNTTSDVPARVKTVTLTEKTNSSLSFEWESPACGYKRGPITGYRYLVMTEDGEEIVEDVTEMSHVTIGDLNPCSTYDILVKSLNGYTNITGLFSPKANGTTLDARPDKIHNVAIIDVGVTSAFIQWSPSINVTCAVRSYAIYVTLLNPRKCGRVEDVETIKAGETTQTDFTLDELLPYSIYYVYVEASTSAGSGERTQIILTTLQGVPEMPKDVHLSVNIPGHLSFTWSSLDCIESNGIVQGYNYILMHNGEDVLSNDNVTDTTHIASFNDEVTLPCIDYVFKVRAYTVNGYGEFAPAVHVTTVPAVPPAVENVSINNVDGDPSKLFVHWELPSAFDTCKINDFLVMYGVVSLDNCHDDDESLQHGTSSIILTNSTAIVLDELHPNTLYNVTITARTAAGQGDNVSVVHHTPEAPPSAPPRVYTFPPLQKGTLYFSWEPLPCDEQNGVMTGYNVTLEGADFFVSEKVSLDQRSKQFDSKLLPCTEYEFRVNGINRAGMGPRSRPEIVSTVSVPPEPVQTLSVQSILDEPTMLNITWTMPSNQICLIDNYTITTSLIRRIQCTSLNVLWEDRDVIDGTENSFRQMDLFPSTLYNVTIMAATVAGMGHLKSFMASTSESAPSGPPIDVTLRRASPQNLTFTWDPPYCVNRNGEITGYRFYLMDDRNGTVNGEISDTEITVPGLVPYTLYEFRVSAMTKAGFGPYSTVVNGKTLPGVPTMPRELDVTKKTKNSLYVQWQKPQPSHGMIVGYKLAYWKTDNNGQDNRSVAINGPAVGHTAIQDSYNITNLQPYTRYSLQVQARTDIGYGVWSRPIIIARTGEGVPSAPVEFKVESRLQTRLSLSWKEPDQPNGKILSYNVIYKAIEKPFDPSFLPSDDITITLNHLSMTIVDLDPATKYEISIDARTSAGPGPLVTIHDYTRPPRPKSPRKPQQLKSDSKLKVRLQLAPVDGDFSVYHVSVKRTPEEKLDKVVYRRAVVQPSNYLDNSENYITAEFSKDNLPENFTVGDNSTYGGYYNAPLMSGSQYAISFCTVSRTSRDTESSCSEPIEIQAINRDQQQAPTTGIPFDLMAIAAGILFFIVIVIVMFAAIRKRRHSRSVNVTETRKGDEFGMLLVDVKRSTTNGMHTGSPIKRSTRLGPIRNKPRVSTSPMSPHKGWRPPTPISIPNLPKYIKQRKADGEKGFTRDFDSMPAGQTYPWEVAKIIANKTKNRYANIIAYDHSRVILEPYEDVPHSDYVNANYVDGFKAPNKYIASQGPNQASTVDFWRMIWQEKVPKIIMLTNIVENGKKKCEKYWPCGIQRYGELTITMIQETVNEYYTERAFNMEDNYMGEQRVVKQYHFTAWPDMGLPESPTPLLLFTQNVKEYQPLTIQGPTVVHCSAGVGRTGTYLAIDAALDMALADRKINVLDYVYRMRQRRIKMVQTQKQYMFIYEVLLEALLCGETVFPSDTFPNRYNDLKKHNPLTDKPYIEEQLRALDVMSTMTSEDNARGGRAPDNMEKNRYQHLIPIDKYRPYLMTQWKSRTNYINATFLDTYRQKDGFIGTQMPLVTTTIDFWRMVYDYKSNVIVMLNRLDLLDCAQYWPDNGTFDYGPFDVELMSAEECGETIIRTFKLKHMDNRVDSRIVHQYQYLGWPERETFPTSPSSLLALVELVQRGQRMAGNGPITVHCMDGVSRTGLFCGIVAALARHRSEEVVDVFHSVKKLRKARAGMVCTLDHYVYCYNTMLTYLESNQTYVNY